MIDTIPWVDGFHLQVAGEVTVALTSAHSGIVLPFCKNSTVPAVPTTTVIVTSDWYFVEFVTVTATDCGVEMIRTEVDEDETELYVAFAAIVAVTEQVPEVLELRRAGELEVVTEPGKVQPLAVPFVTT